MNSYVQKPSMNMDSSQNSAAMPLAKTTRVIAVALAFTFVCALLAIETKLLHSGALVVVIPE